MYKSVKSLNFKECSEDIRLKTPEDVNIYISNLSLPPAADEKKYNFPVDVESIFAKKKARRQWQ